MAKTVEEFRLQYDRLFPGAYRKYHWDNEGEVEGKEFPTTPSNHYSTTTQRTLIDPSSPCARRTAIDFMLNECLTVMKVDGVGVWGAAGDTRPKTPNPWSDIKIYGGAAAPPSPSLVVSGSSDRGIGSVLHSRVKNAAEHPTLASETTASEKNNDKTDESDSCSTWMTIRS
ncbi:hypothetical protein K443DRAFT_6871 [Laccaria amethystina LaAM-08-1]|uniref:Uncharacterized protein n=1 Tax=Laccaria amethystina LaAM-08-1 TaxID=1095629 RepID=A0A0C9X911_9AGAR|nr:hypothetical protein K443DRAFT_6871 [Laccaria amethystina LaAM-08-1]